MTALKFLTNLYFVTTRDVPHQMSIWPSFCRGVQLNDTFLGLGAQTKQLKKIKFTRLSQHIYQTQIVDDICHVNFVQ